MLTFVVIVLLGLSFAFVAVQNTGVATFNLLGYTWALPMYVIVSGALLIGFFVSWIVNSISMLGTWFNLHGKDRKIHESQQTVAQLQDRIRELELENARYKGQNRVPHDEKVAEKPVIEENKPRNFLDRFRRNHAY